MFFLAMKWVQNRVYRNGFFFTMGSIKNALGCSILYCYCSDLPISNPKYKIKEKLPYKISNIFSEKKKLYILGRMQNKHKNSYTFYSPGLILTKCKIKELLYFSEVFFLYFRIYADQV